jgi:N-acetylmuramoyl-L-alanine amidase
MIAPVCAALALALAVSAGRPARAPARTPHAAKHVSAARPSALERAKAMLAQVKRDPARRRYRHHWERAIEALERAARGGDRAQGLLDASRARYALYRFSQVDADRDAALRLALRARRAGARDAARFAAAIRKEMGEEEPRRATPRPAVSTRSTSTSTSTTASTTSETEPDPETEGETASTTDSASESDVAAVVAALLSTSDSRSGSETGAEGEDEAEATANAESTPEVAASSAEPGARRTNQEARPAAPAAPPAHGSAPAGAARSAHVATSSEPSASSVAGAPPAPSGRAGATARGGTASPTQAPEGSRPQQPTANTSPAAGPDDDDGEDDDALKQALADEPSPAGPTDAAGDKGPVRVSEVRSWSNKDYTRVAIYLSRRVEYEKQEIPPDGTHPRRVALDFTPATLEHGLAHPVGDSLVARVRAAQYDSDTVRVVLELPGKDAITAFRVDDPPRLIVDVGLREARHEAQAAAVHPPEGEARRGARAPAPRPPDGKARDAIRRIIVDAGHGGHDSGAVGPTRVREKDVTLAIAKRLARRLRERGFEALLTRDDDRYLALEERTAIANARHGDLFISVHANAHPHRSQRGVETYILNVTDDRYARRLAARENGALSDEGGEELEVRRILSDLNAQSSAEASRRLAGMVQREVCTGIRSRVGDVRDLGVKSALFYVLLGARMPAVLIETSFISNRAEEKRLASPRFQEEVAASVARAVSAFAEQDARVAAR